MTLLSLSSVKKVYSCKVIQILGRSWPNNGDFAAVCVLGCLYSQVQSVHIRTDVIKPS